MCLFKRCLHILQRLLNLLDGMLRSEQKFWYWLYSDYRFEEVISVCYRTLPILALGRALHCELVALTGGHIAGQTTSLPEGWVKTTAFGGYFLGCSIAYFVLCRDLHFGFIILTC